MLVKSGANVNAIDKVSTYSVGHFLFAMSWIIRCMMTQATYYLNLMLTQIPFYEIVIDYN